jgi:hypothetical protein
LNLQEFSSLASNDQSFTKNEHHDDENKNIEKTSSLILIRAPSGSTFQNFEQHQILNG